MADITAYTKQQADQLLAGKYSKPAEGVPKSDLASGVQASLEKADAALTKTDADATYATVKLVSDTVHYGTDGNVDYTVAGGIRTDYTWNSDGTCHTETSQGLVKTWTYDGSGNPVSSTVTEV